MQTIWRDRLWKRIKSVTWIEWMVIVAIAGFLVVLLRPPIISAGSGELTLPVHILVFDAVTRAPISGAQVDVLRGPYTGTKWSAVDLAEESKTDWPDGFKSYGRQPTNADGIAEIPFRFYTSSNQHDPVAKTNTASVWVTVKADKYGGCLTPLRYQRTPNEQLEKAGNVHVLVGLFPSP